PLGIAAAVAAHISAYFGYHCLCIACHTLSIVGSDDVGAGRQSLHCEYTRYNEDHRALSSPTFRDSSLGGRLSGSLRRTGYEMATVGDRIKQVREARGWTQEKLANAAKISPGFLSDVEKHGKNISLELLLRVANALGASVGYLATGEGTQPGERKPIVIPPEL